jgi:hypothetical protein
MKNLLDKAQTATRAQRRIALALLVGVLLLAPSLPAALMVVVAAVAVWASAQPLLVGIVLGAVGLHRHRKAGAR